MSVMGIDPSLTSTGYAILESGGAIARHGTVSSKAGPPMKRLDDIRNDLWHNAEHAPRSHVRLVAIEGYAFGARGAAVFSLGELGGVLRMMLWEHAWEYIDVPPSQVKKFATGKGNSKKDEIMLAVYKRWGQEFHTSDEADAYVLARIALALTEGDDNLTEFQREVIKSLSKEMVK